MSKANETLGQVPKWFSSLKMTNKILAPLEEADLYGHLPGVPASPTPQALMLVAVGDEGMKRNMKTIQPPNQPTPKGHYSPGIEHNGLVYVSGQLPMDLETREPFAGDIETQAELALRNVEAVLNAAGSDLDHVLQMTIYVSDIELWDKVNETYARVMGDHRPARAIVPVKDLHFGTQIEIQAIAAKKD